MFKYEFTRLLVSNFKGCFRFYRDVLGLQPVYGAEDGTYADFATGSVSIALFDKQEMSQALGTRGKAVRADSQDSVCLVFGVESVDAACERLVEHGVSLLVGPTDHSEWGIRTAHFRDPAGNLIEINQPLTQP
jgi:catechol 2,3-dioxygenase-like lactoylglutathione lyase family enzyme